MSTNHFPGLEECCSKSFLSRSLSLFHDLFPEKFDFYPSSYILPSEYEEFQQQFHSSKTYIFKPSEGTQGKGIQLAQTEMQIQKIIRRAKEEQSQQKHKNIKLTC